ncbi:nitrogen regulation protein NR(II) [Comamonas sp. GB3 AK4-5]|uniref:two-component system sensor histidine kinase NtrB n=1 Tax=Comamonas sp. GB3 AK4-5 TaxID=3231487 RepID=UPI00351E557F
MLVTMVWLAGRYEASQVQDKLERDTAGAVSEVRAALARNTQDLQALNAGEVGKEDWRVRAAELLQVRREMLRIEWRNPDMAIVAHAETPYRNEYWSGNFREDSDSHALAACASARRTNTTAYSSSYFQVLGEGMGMELIEACLPLQHQGRFDGYEVVTYSLPYILSAQVSKNLTRNQEVSFTEPDGTRLALVGAVWRGTRVFSAQQLLDLPGHTLVLRMDSWHRAPSVFPNVLTALVTAMSIALVSVLIVLVRDNRRRLRAERDLGDALAFRKAMEDSLITGLRARDLQGRISYVNPAFCAMVGFTTEELLGLDIAPYWPPELAQEYRKRQGWRLSGAIPTVREGHESMFMRKDGTRFPVLIFEAPLINAQGQHTGWMSAFIDISEQRRIEEISRASQERLQATARLATVGEMASLLSHELTQPLMAIASYASGSLHLLEGTGSTPVAQLPAEQARDQLQELVTVMRKIGFQADRAGRVIKSVRDFVRRRDQSREAVQPQELLDAVMPLVRMQARKLGVQVDVEQDALLPAVLCDVTMVEQVLLNLTRNGMQAMDDAQIEPRQLTVTVRHPRAHEVPDRLVFSVSDWGVGIPDSVAQQLFGAFFTTRPEGMGLGLSLCRTVVEQHGGQLQFTPNLPRGTVFTFTLPIAESA